MKNVLATFQHMIMKVIAGLQGCEGHIDDVVVYAETWEEYLHRMKQLFLRLRVSELTVNLANTELGCAHVVYLGHVVGQGHVKPVDIKVSAVVKFPVPTSRQELVRFGNGWLLYEVLYKFLTYGRTPYTPSLQGSEVCVGYEVYRSFQED